MCAAGALLLAACAPLSGAPSYAAETAQEFAYQFACFTMVLDNTPLLEGLETEQKASEAEAGGRLVREHDVPIGAPPRTAEIDWTRQWMFALGLLLFWASWLLAVWDRAPKEYIKPLYTDEAAPRPKPPGIVFALGRIERSKAS